MALTFVKSPGNFVAGNKRMRVRTITFDNSYPTGGYAITPKQVDLNKVIDFVFGTAAPLTSDGSTARIVSWNYATGKLQVYATASAEIANATDLSTFSVRLCFMGS